MRIRLHAMPVSLSPYLAVSLFAAMLVLIELGYRLRTQYANEPDRALSAAMEAALFSVFGLLLAFNFSGAMSRYDNHRTFIVKEVNAIGTVAQRLDLLPPTDQPPLRQLLRQYAEVRAHRFDTVDTPAVAAASAESKLLQQEIWVRSVAASVPGKPGVHADAAKLLLPSINEMIDAANDRKYAFEMHPPNIVFLLLFLLAMICALVAGYSARGSGRNWVQRIGFAAAISFTLYATIDIEYPRYGGLVTLRDRSQVYDDLIQTLQ